MAAVDYSAALDSSPKLRREQAMRSPVWWATHYCGLRYAVHLEELLLTYVKEYAAARATRQSARPEKRRVVVIMPRDHSKTESVCAFASQAIAVDRSTRCLFVGESQAVATKRVGKIKGILMSPRVQQDWCSEPGTPFGPLLPPRGSDSILRTKWGESIVQVLRPLNLVDPTLEAVGIGGAITGGHFDLIIIDDPETYESVFSPAMRKKRLLWLRSTVLPMLVPGGLLVLIGTRKHADDLYSHSLDDPTWARHEREAIIEWPDSHEPILEDDEHGRQRISGWDIKGDHQVLWPEERPLEYLLEERASMGATNFAREFQGDIVDDEASPFKRTWLDAAKRRGRHLAIYRGDVRLPGGGWPEGLLIVQGWDPAFTYDQQQATSGDRSWAAGLTIAADLRTRERYLLGLFRERGASPRTKALNVVREYRIWAPPANAYDQSIPDYADQGWCFAVAMERNSAGELQLIDAELAGGLPIVAHWTGNQVHDPFKGVPSLAAQFERGMWTLPDAPDPDTRELVGVLVEELHGMGTARHDDCVKALWVAEVLLRQALQRYDEYLEAG